MLLFLFLLIAATAYLAYHLSTRHQQRINYLHRRIDSMADHLDDLEDARLTRLWRVRCLHAWDRIRFWRGDEIGGFPLPFVPVFAPPSPPLPPRVVPQDGGVPVFALWGVGGGEGVDPLDMRGLRRGSRYGEDQKGGFAGQLETEEQAGCERELGCRIGDGWQRMDCAFTRDEGVGGNDAARMRTGAAEAETSRRFGSRWSSSSSDDDDEVEEQDPDISRGFDGMHSLYGTTLHASTAQLQNDASQPPEHTLPSTHHLERADHHFEYWHYNDEEDAESTKDRSQNVPPGRIVVTHGITVESAPVDVHSSPLPPQTITTTSPPNNISINTDHCTGIPTPQPPQAPAAQGSSDPEDLNARNKRTMAPPHDQKQQRSEEQHTYEEEVALAALLHTPVQWPYLSSPSPSPPAPAPPRSSSGG